VATPGLRLPRLGVAPRKGAVVPVLWPMVHGLGSAALGLRKVSCWVARPSSERPSSLGKAAGSMALPPVRIRGAGRVERMDS
jgi:hypothetical protein